MFITFNLLSVVQSKNNSLGAIVLRILLISKYD